MPTASACWARRSFDPIALASCIRRFLAQNPEVTMLTVPIIQRAVGGAVFIQPHVVERAFDRLNKSGELSLAIHGRRGGCRCGDHRAARYTVRRPAKKTKRRG